MKIKSISIQGFRGFNELRTIELDDRLTFIYAPNSYGKTSISEALEWLLYGITSKVEKADSKDEYKGSYRNLHLDPSEPSFVNVAFWDNGNELKFTGALVDGDEILKLVDGNQVENWPLSQDLQQCPPPFILQHALKYLLLAGPDERFQGFANLLGLEKLDEIQRNIRSLCTKPDANLPDEAQILLGKVGSIESKLARQPTLSKINKAYKKGAKGLKKIYEEIDKECKKHVPPETEPGSILPQLLQKRDDAVGKIFEESIVLPDYTQQEKGTRGADERFMVNFVDEAFINKYTGLGALSAARDVIDRINFYGLGFAIMAKEPEKCPFCEQVVDSHLEQHIRDQHQKLVDEKSDKEKLETQSSEVRSALTSLKMKLQSYNQIHIGRSTKLLGLEPSLDKLKKILEQKYKTHYDAAVNTISDIEGKKEELSNYYDDAVKALGAVVSSIDKSEEDVGLLKTLGFELAKYINSAFGYAECVSDNAIAMSEADKVLQNELDELAGTEDISLLVDLINSQKNIAKVFAVRKFLAGLKALKDSVDDYVANKVINAISQDLTSEVMDWYEKIKTTGDPDVHFSGFDMERTKTGKVKARKVAIKAESYGKELVSAVSSLSESKLNALGLCVSIARNLKAQSPFSFLIIDDPIQSWDAEHETQFIELLQLLIDRGKQILLMSHNKRWIDMVRAGCRSMSGRYYEFTGYTKEGPNIVEVPWLPWRYRLDDIDATLNDPGATAIKLQHAEEDIRIVCSEISCEIYCKKTGKKKSARDLNARKVRKILLESGIANSLVDRITMTYQTTDDAHHAPVYYEAVRQRIRKYHSWAHELAREI